MSSGGGGTQQGTQQVVQNTSPWIHQQPWVRESFMLGGGGMVGSPILDQQAALQANPELLNMMLRERIPFSQAAAGINLDLSPYVRDFQYPEYFPQSTVVPFSPQTEAALGLQEGRALAGSPLIGAAQDELGQTLSGGYLGMNPAHNLFQSTAYGPTQNAAYNLFNQLYHSPGITAGQYAQPMAQGFGGTPGSEMISQAGQQNVGLPNNIYGIASGQFGTQGADRLNQLQNYWTGLPQSTYDIGAGNQPIPGQDFLTSAGQAGTGPAQSLFGGTAAGQYLGANPFLDAEYDKAARAMTRQFSDAVIPGIDSRFAASGRLERPGTGDVGGQYFNMRDMATRNLGESLADLGTGIYGQNYQAERNRQMAAQQALQTAFGQDQARKLQAGQAIQAGGLQGRQQQLASAGLQSGHFLQNIQNQMAAAQAAGGLDQAQRAQAMQASGLGLQAGFGNIANQLQAGGQLAGITDAERARQLGAIGQLGGFQAGNIGNQLAAAGGLGQTFATDFGQRLGAGEQLGDLYQRERENQLRSMLFAPQMANQDYYDIGQLGQAGLAYEGLAQQQLADQIARWNFEQAQTTDAGRLQQYAPFLHGTFGGQSLTSTTAPFQQQSAFNPWLTGLGAGLSLLGAPMSGGGSVFGNLLGGLF